MESPTGAAVMRPMLQSQVFFFFLAEEGPVQAGLLPGWSLAHAC